MKALLKKVTPDFIIRQYQKYQAQKEAASYSGDAVICPICGSTYKMFAPFGVVKRKNAKCLNCGSRERHRLLFLYLTEKKALFEGKTKIRLLHFAPEKAFYNLFSQNENIEYIPCDLFPEIYNYGGSTEVQKVDITDIPFEQDYFDVVLCNHVLEHIPDDTRAMSEIHRVLKRGAWSILQVPIDYNREKTYEDFSITAPEEREKAFGQKDHVRWYGRDYVDRLRSVGFNVTEDDYIKKFSAEDVFRYGLMSSHLIYYCEK